VRDTRRETGGMGHRGGVSQARYGQGTCYNKTIPVVARAMGLA